jgi:hypothetical protein
VPQPIAATSACARLHAKAAAVGGSSATASWPKLGGSNAPSWPTRGVIGRSSSFTTALAPGTCASTVVAPSGPNRVLRTRSSCPAPMASV